MLKVFLTIILLQYVLALDTGPAKANGNSTAKRKSLVPLLYNRSLPNITITKVPNCSWLKGYKHQRKQCQVRKGLEKVLLDTRKLIINSCKQNFKYDTWNCTYDKDQFKKVSRETAFMQSLAAAALMYTATQACSNKKLDKCKCDSTKEYLTKVPEYKNSTICQDNTKSGRVLAKNLLTLQNTGKKTKALNLNVKFGIKTVMESVKIDCRCSPVFSGSCFWKICEKRIQPFVNIMEKLKLAYHNAIKLSSKHLSVTDSTKHPLPKDRILYLAESPNFCNLTTGRRCTDPANCATLCCGRGANSKTITVKKICNYRLTECCYKITHEICTQEQYVYECR